jgi:hypothetical protein
MARTRLSLLAAAMLALVALSSPAQAQWGDPFATLEYRVTPACPFDCDSVSLVLSGELTSTSWKPPELMSWDRQGDSISVYVRVEFDPNATLPVLVPFELVVPLGELLEGSYRVVCTIFLDNPIATMPMVPFVTVTDNFRVAPPGDQNCDGVVDIVDVVELIGYVFRGGLPPDPVKRTDVNCDGRADISDVVQLVYYVFRGGSICDPCSPSGLLPVNPTELPVDSLRRDSFELLSAQTVGDTLRLRIAHGGGCLVHTYVVYWAPPSFEGPVPRVAHLHPQHIDPGDPCDAWITVDLAVDLRLVAVLYRFIYGYDASEVILRIHGFDPQTFIDAPYQLPPPPPGVGMD